jgi:ankyrin repeat protein
VARQLIRGGADLNIKNDSDETALHLAVMGNHPQVVEELLSNGATVGERLCGSPVG